MPNEYGNKFGRAFHGKLIGLDIDLNESIDFKFFEAEDADDPVYGPKPLENKDHEDDMGNSNNTMPKIAINDKKEQDNTRSVNTLTTRSSKNRELMNCIAFGNEEAYNKDSYIHAEWNEADERDDLDSLSTDTTSDITDITPRPSSSGCSSMTKMESEKEIKAKRSGRKLKYSRSDFNKQKGSMRLLKDAIENLEHEDRGSSSSSRTERKVHGRGRFSMTFTNEELEKIDRENHHLLKRIESNHNRKHSKPGLFMFHPRLSSAAINRQKQQRIIEYENLVS
ncbi:cilia- and flagella-associated protein 97-like [Anabrus simplex]|uniref:cilia- and flagella-associated protein 97-like n=1 Tax=Anabrus simplex TaxID=316456 RepID=UPI0035A29588